VRLLGRGNLFVGFAAPRIFHCPHPSYFGFGASNFLIRNLATPFFVSVFTRFSFDTLPLVVSAIAREFLFDFAPTFLLDAQSIFCGQSFGFDL
jgi:hypothetical protein